MAIDKNKIIEAATKFVQKGQYDKAIKEYQKLLEVDPKDARIQQKLGELYQKKGDNTLAADCFLKVAESYAADGFFLKAVAVYKQVLKLNPNLVDVNLKLAELHQQLGLMSDAMAQFQLVANHYEKSGNIRASLDTLRKMVDLDPENVASRIKLAELYARENMNPDAIAEFGRAAEYLKRNNRVDDYIKVAERLVFLDPNNLDLTRELANIYLTKQDTKRALAKLQICFKADPKDVETLTMLAQAFKDLGQIAKTVSVFKELAKIYDEQDRVDEERETWRKIQDLAPEDPDVRARFATAAPAQQPAAAAPQQPQQPQAAPAARPAQAAAPAPKPAADQIPRLLTETDVYVKYGLHEKAIEHLKKVFAIDPDSVDAHEKAADLYAASGNVQGALDSLVRVVRTCIARGELDRARVALQKLCEKEPTHPEIPGFLNAVGGLAPVEEVAEIEEDAILVEAADEAIEVAPEPEHPVDLAAVSIANSDDAALDAAAESLASEEPSGEGPELLAESASPEEELIAGPTDDELALSSAESSPELIEQEPLVDPGFEEPVEEPQDLAPAEAEEQAFAAQQQEDVEIEHSSAEFAIPPEEQVQAEDLGEQSGQLGDQEELGEALEGPDARPDVEQELHPTMPGRQTMPAAARRQPDEADEHEEATRVADLPMLLMQSAGPKEIRKTGSMEPLQPAEGQPLDEGSDDEPTSVLPALKAKSQESPKTQPNLRNAQEVLDAAKASSAATPVPGLGKPAKPEAKAAKPVVKPEPVKAVAPKPEPEPEAEEEGAQDELDESAFFMDQGMLEEAREILETVMLAYPGSTRAKELMSRLEELEAGGAAATTGETETPASEAEAPALVETTADGAFDLASELAKEDLGDLGGPIAPATDDFQVSVEDVFGEFKKGLKKVVKPEDVETHFDLGIAYKEMGLIDDAIGEFEQAAAAAAGKKKELEALAMVGTCQVERDALADAAEAFQRALALPQVTPDIAKAVQFDLALVFEKMGKQGDALALFRKVQKTDPDFRRVGEAVDRLVADGVEEPPAKPARPANGSTASKAAVKPDSATGPEKADPKAGGTGKRAGKIGYV